MKNLYKRREKLWGIVLNLLKGDITVPLSLIEELIRVDIELEKGCKNGRNKDN